MNSHRLYYYPTDSGIGALGFVDLLNVSRIAFARNDHVSINLFTPKRTYHLKAPTRNEALYWVTGLNLWKDYFTFKRRSTCSSPSRITFLSISLKIICIIFVTCSYFS